MILDLIFWDMLLIYNADNTLLYKPFLITCLKKVEERERLKEVLIEIPALPCDHVSAPSREVGVTARAPHRIH